MARPGKVAIHGAAGKVGIELLKAVHASSDMQLVAAIDQIKPVIIEVLQHHFIFPEIAKILSQGKGLNLDDIWLVQLVFWDRSKGPEVRFNEKVRADFVTQSSCRNLILGKISREEIENLKPGTWIKSLRLKMKRVYQM